MAQLKKLMPLESKLEDTTGALSQMWNERDQALTLAEKQW